MVIDEKLKEIVRDAIARGISLPPSPLKDLITALSKPKQGGTK